MSTLAGPQPGTRPRSAPASNLTASLARLNPPGKLGLNLLVFYLYLITGRALDFSPIWFLHIPMIMLIVLMIMTVAGGNLNYAMSSSISKYFLAFTIWVVACFPFSYWRAGS